MKTPHTHAWETVQQCFECGHIREYAEDELLFSAWPCPDGKKEDNIGLPNNNRVKPIDTDTDPDPFESDDHDNDCDIYNETMTFK
jgi:hypothetical protein